MNIKYSECVLVDLGIQHAMRMRHIVICGLSGSKYFSALSHKRQNFRIKNYIKHKIVFRFSLQLLNYFSFQEGLSVI